MSHRDIHGKRDVCGTPKQPSATVSAHYLYITWNPRWRKQIQVGCFLPNPTLRQTYTNHLYPCVANRGMICCLPSCHHTNKAQWLSQLQSDRPPSGQDLNPSSWDFVGPERRGKMNNTILDIIPIYRYMCLCPSLCWQYDIIPFSRDSWSSPDLMVHLSEFCVGPR